MYCGVEVSGMAHFAVEFEREKSVTLIMQCFPQGIPFFRGDASRATVLLDGTNQRRRGAAGSAG
jgi:hypothetical protein